MPESRSHRTAANRIARKLGTVYNDGKGPDIKSKQAVVEVETPETVNDAPKQLKGYQAKVYIAGTNREALKKALEVTQGTTIGVMDNQGNIVKPSTRKH